MLRLRHVPVVKVLIPFIAGSLCGYIYDINAEPLALFLLSILAWMTVLLIFRTSGRGKFFVSRLFSLFVPGIFVLAGMGIGILEKPQDPSIPEAGKVIIRGKIREAPESRNNSLVFGVNLRLACLPDSLYHTHSFIKVYMPVNQNSALPEEGEEWVFTGSLMRIKNSGNPGEIDYAAILQRKDCWYRFYVDTLQGLNYQVIPSTTRSGSRFELPDAGKLRLSLSAHWEGSGESQALLKAVCLGDRSGLSEEILSSYSLAGGMHVLAVSGLHVGLIWWVLNQLFYFIVLLGKPELYRTLIVTLILWAYAYMTGFSSSVSRAVLMFSFYSISRLMYHRGHSVNAILISMFFLLVINPGRIMDLGFQLSYSAVLSIVMLNTFFRQVWRPRNRLIRWCWEASGVSLAAQLGTLPLVIYYFHQLPVYALLTNLLALPILSLIIVLFMVSAPFLVMGSGTVFFNPLLNLSAWVLNKVMEIIASFPGAAIEDLYMDQITTASLLLAFFLLFLYLNSWQRISLYLSLFVSCFTWLWNGLSAAADSQVTECRVSHFRNGSLISLREGLLIDHYLLTEKPGTLVRMDEYLGQVWGKSRFENAVLKLEKEQAGFQYPGAASLAIQMEKNAYLLGNENFRALILCGNPGKKQMSLLSGLDIDFSLLSGEPVLNFEKLSLPGTYVVADGSCRSWYLDRLRKSGMSFYSTSQQGAFVLPY